MKKHFVFILIFLGFGFYFFAFQSRALTISPAKFVFTADPGQIIETKMNVHNDLDRTVTYYPSFDRYTVTVGGEEPVFFPVDSGLPTWIEVAPAELNLAPKETITVSIKINVPKDAPPGGHYAVIFWSNAPPVGEGTGVGIVTKVGALVLLEVSGDVKESGEIVDFLTPQKFYSHLPVNFSYHLKNTGNVHVRPDGEVNISNIFGKTANSLDANPARAYVLPNTKRNIVTGSWLPKKTNFAEIEGKGFFAELRREVSGFAFGYYKANLNLEYGKEKKTTNASFGFFVLPWRLLLIIILFLAILLFIFTKGIKVYNRRIIAKARESRK